MKFRRQLMRVVPAIMGFAFATILGSAQCLAQNAYITTIQGTVAVINTATNTVTSTILSSGGPASFGIFIQPPPRFAVTPGEANGYGQSVLALAQQYGGLNNAAAALGYPSVTALQSAIQEYCEA